jgi:hypothetical protein
LVGTRCGLGRCGLIQHGNRTFRDVINVLEIPAVPGMVEKSNFASINTCWRCQVRIARESLAASPVMGEIAAQRSQMRNPVVRTT